MRRSTKDMNSYKKHRHTSVSGEAMPQSDDASGRSGEAASQRAEQKTVIPVLREELTLGKRVVETGKGVRIRKTVSKREQIVDEALAKDEVIIERVDINKVVDSADIPNTYYDGETMVVPVLEEVLVLVSKRN
jgi:uncharacterized protein (TIGR02271 family)